MVDVIGILIIVAGLLLLFTGAAVSIYGVAFLGAFVGGALGYLISPTLGDLIGLDSTLAIAVGIALGVIVGILLAYTVLTIAIAVVSFFVGTFFGAAVIAPFIMDQAWYFDWAVGLAIGLAAGFLAMILTRTVLILITSGAGAALASTNVTRSTLRRAQEQLSIDPLTFEPIDPLFLALFILGILSQFGLFKFGYVTKLVRHLPGSSVITDRRR